MAQFSVPARTGPIAHTQFSSASRWSVTLAPVGRFLCTQVRTLREDLSTEPSPRQPCRGGCAAADLAWSQLIHSTVPTSLFTTEPQLHRLTGTVP
jgi:hypothetical protein